MLSQSFKTHRSTVEGVTAKVVTLDEVHEVLSIGQIPVLLASEPFLVKKVIDKLKPVAVIDAIIAKRNIGTQITDAPIVIGVWTLALLQVWMYMP